MSRAGETTSFANVSATPAAFTARGGKYLAEAVATWGGGSAKLQRLANDGLTFVSIGSSTDFAANGVAVVDLSPGQYQLLIATATGVYFDLKRIPGE